MSRERKGMTYWLNYWTHGLLTTSQLTHGLIFSWRTKMLAPVDNKVWVTQEVDKLACWTVFQLIHMQELLIPSVIMKCQAVSFLRPTNLFCDWQIFLLFYYQKVDIVGLEAWLMADWLLWIVLDTEIQRWKFNQLQIKISHLNTAWADELTFNKKENSANYYNDRVCVIIKTFLTTQKNASTKKWKSRNQTVNLPRQ